MKNFKKYISICNILVLLFSLSSCSDFLDEELSTKRDVSYFNTEDGILDLAIGCYRQCLTYNFGGEESYAHLCYGTDEFKVGGDESNAVMNDYSVNLQSVIAKGTNTISINSLWDNMYLGIGYCNLLIRNAEALDSKSEKINIALGEAYFLRAYCYFRLVSQWGGVPLKLVPSESVEREFTRASAKEVYAQIIDDYTKAYNLVTQTTPKPDKIDKSVVAHFLAKAYLSRASEINDSWNKETKNDDLQNVKKLCDEVISSHPLTDNYANLWKFTKPDDDSEFLPEIILSAQYTADDSYGTYNLTHVYYLARYDDLPYMQRDLSGGRPFSRLRPTYYIYRIYDHINDSRLWKSFRTKYNVNKASGNYYKNGDLGIMYVINQPGDNRFKSVKLNDEVIYSKTGKTIPHVYTTYIQGNSDDGALDEEKLRFPSLSKFSDASRKAVNDSKGNRDVILARSAETYLMAAEALIRMGKYQESLSYINKVRERAEYKEGENREEYSDGGAAWKSSTLNPAESTISYIPENSYFESNNIPQTTSKTDLIVNDIHSLPTQDEYIIKKLGYTTDYKRMLCFLLDEKSRELCGEFVRWEDLSRTKTLVERVKAFNSETAASNIKEFHNLRPIPQTFLDEIQKNGKNLTSEEKAALQNPGY